jgi:hypothetical protein
MLSKKVSLKFKMPTLATCLFDVSHGVVQVGCTALMENKGQLIAMDLYESKLKQLKIRAKRDGAFNMNTALSITKVIKITSKSRSCFD